MRGLAAFGALTILLTVAFAGCLNDAPVAKDTNLPVSAWKPLDVLRKIDAKTMLAEHKAFVKTYPYRTRDDPMERNARDFMFKEFSDAGLTPLRMQWKQGWARENICGIVWGEKKDAWVIVGGHYDIVPNQQNSTEGAYDDGSGTRITIALAKSFAKTHPYYTILFCAFDGEESGLLGSKYLYQQIKSEGFPYPVNETHAMLDIDMYGIDWPVHATTWFDQNAPQIQKWVDAKRQSLKIPDAYFKFSRIKSGQSDFACFYNDPENIPTAFFISDFEEYMAPIPGGNPPDQVPQVPRTYPFWHQTDTYETMELMAGGASMLQQGFQTAIDMSQSVVELFAFHPEIKLEAAHGPGKACS